jgi:hypothetical protein
MPKNQWIIRNGKTTKRRHRNNYHRIGAPHWLRNHLHRQDRQTVRELLHREAYDEIAPTKNTAKFWYWM